MHVEGRQLPLAFLSDFTNNIILWQLAKYVLRDHERAKL